MKTCNNCKHLELQPRCKVLNRELTVKGRSDCDERFWVDPKVGAKPYPDYPDSKCATESEAHRPSNTKWQIISKFPGWEASLLVPDLDIHGPGWHVEKDEYGRYQCYGDNIGNITLTPPEAEERAKKHEDELKKRFWKGYGDLVAKSGSFMNLKPGYPIKGSWEEWNKDINFLIMCARTPKIGQEIYF